MGARSKASCNLAGEQIDDTRGQGPEVRAREEWGIGDVI